MTRWQESDDLIPVGGLFFRIQHGNKGPDDLVLEFRTRDGWRKVDMAVAFFLADFFAWNEDELSRGRSHWRRSGTSYFLDAVKSAVVHGWEVPAHLIRDQRARRQAG